MIVGPPENLKHGANEAVFAFLSGKSAHSDIAGPLWYAVKDLPGAVAYCADRNNYGYVVVCANSLAFAFATGMGGVSLRLPVHVVDQVVAKGGETVPSIGPDWVYLPLFTSSGFERELTTLAKAAFEHSGPPSNNSFKPKPLRGSA